MAMMISWVTPVNPSHPYLENNRLRRLTPTICAFHLGFSLGGIGLAISLPIQVAIGAKVAGDRERKTIGQIEDTSRVINVRHTMIDKMQPRLTDLGSQAREQNMQLLRGTAQLQAVLNIHDKDATETKDAVNTLLEMLVNARELCSAMKEAMDDTESCFRQYPFPTFS